MSYVQLAGCFSYKFSIYRALDAAVQPLLEVNVELIYSNVSDNFFLDLLEAVQSQANTSQLNLHPPLEEVACWNQIQ
jgi:hypothetical protein